MLLLQNFVSVLIIQCCLAFHLPKQHAGYILGEVGNGSIKRFKSVSLRASSADMKEPMDSDRPETNPVVARNDVGEYDFERKLGLQRQTAVVGAPQAILEEDASLMNITQVMTELQAIQSQGPKKYCILGTRHCSFLHQQIVEML